MVCSRKTAYVWSLSVIILTLSAAASDASHWSTKQESRDSLRLQSSSTAKTDEGKAAQSNNKCDCGLYGECAWNDKGDKTCNCKEGYGDKDGECTKCDCWLNYYDSIIINCNFTDGIQTCLCFEGFEDDSGSCIDINECLNPSACPANSTCSNWDGGYDCNCDRGFLPLNNDAKRYGCTAINECLDDYTCPHPNTTECVKTQGRYHCQCKKGYTSSSPSQYVIQTRGCEEDRSGWRVGYIILIVACIIVVCSILMLIILKRRRSSS